MFPCAHAIYEETYLEGATYVSRVARGHSVYTLENCDMFNGTKDERARASEGFYPELTTTIQAAALLNQDIVRACLALDAKRNMKEVK